MKCCLPKLPNEISLLFIPCFSVVVLCILWVRGQRPVLLTLQALAQVLTQQLLGWLILGLHLSFLIYKMRVSVLLYWGLKEFVSKGHLGEYLAQSKCQLRYTWCYMLGVLPRKSGRALSSFLDKLWDGNSPEIHHYTTLICKTWPKPTNLMAEGICQISKGPVFSI